MVLLSLVYHNLEIGKHRKKFRLYRLEIGIVISNVQSLCYISSACSLDTVMPKVRSQYFVSLSINTER